MHRPEKSWVFFPTLGLLAAFEVDPARFSHYAWKNMAKFTASPSSQGRKYRQFACPHCEGGMFQTLFITLVHISANCGLGCIRCHMLTCSLGSRGVCHCNM